MRPSFDQAKADYQEIKATDALRKRVMSHFENEIQEETTPMHTTDIPSRKQSHHHFWKRALSAAAALLIAFGIGINVSPAFADAIASVPGMAGVIQVLTFGRYQFADGSVEVNIETPQIEGLLNEELQNKLNAEFKEYAETLILGVEADIKALQADFPGETVHYGMDSGFEVITDSSSYLVIDVYLVNTVGSSTTLHNYYTIDKATQALVTLPSLFKDKTEYLSAIETCILEEMRRQMDAGEATYWLDDPAMMPDPLLTEEALFFINNEGALVIAFEEYSVAPGSEGTPAFVIPEAVIAEFRRD